MKLKLILVVICSIPIMSFAKDSAKVILKDKQARSIAADILCNEEVNQAKCSELLTNSAQNNPFTQGIINLIALKLGNQFSCGKITSWQMEYHPGNVTIASTGVFCSGKEQNITITLKGPIGLEHDSVTWGVDTNSVTYELAD